MDEFDVEFRGLFWGEGTMSIDAMAQRRSDTKGRFLYPRLRVSMAKWERPVLEAVRDRYGGSITVSKRDASITWSLTGREKLSRVIAVLEGGVLPTPKLAELALFAEGVSLIAPRGGHHTEETRQRLRVVQARLLEIKEELSAMKYGGRGSRKLSQELSQESEMTLDEALRKEVSS